MTSWISAPRKRWFSDAGQRDTPPSRLPSRRSLCAARLSAIWDNGTLLFYKANRKERINKQRDEERRVRFLEFTFSKSSVPPSRRAKKSPKPLWHRGFRGTGEVSRRREVLSRGTGAIENRHKKRGPPKASRRQRSICTTIPISGVIRHIRCHRSTCI